MVLLIKIAYIFSDTQAYQDWLKNLILSSRICVCIRVEMSGIKNFASYPNNLT